MLRHARTFRAFAPLLMALALLARLLVPAGFMPSTDGIPGVTICTGQGATMLAAEPDHAPVDHDHPSDHGCPFASMAAAADRVVLPVVSLLVVRAADVARIAPLTAVRPGLGLAAPPPPKTGPPALR